MLYMVVNTHNPESCAFRGQDEGRILSDAFDRLDGQAAEQGALVNGSWVNRGAHEVFVLVDAPTLTSSKRRSWAPASSVAPTRGS